MISALVWARRGVPAAVPGTQHPVAQDATDTSNEAPKGAEELEVDRPKAGGKRRIRHDEPSDSESDGEDSRGRLDLPSMTGNLAFYSDPKDDPHLSLKEEEDIDSDEDDFTLEATDLVLIGARSEEQFSSVEVFVYEEPHDNLYAHHDVPLPVFPLCLAWMDFRPRPALLSHPEAAAAPRANMLAVGTFAPFIEIWDLDVIDVLEPVAVLGAEGAQAALDAQDGAAAEAVRRQNRKGDEAKKDKKTKKKKGGASGGGVEGHTDAVMALAWGHLRRNVLASGSADHTVRLWDLAGNHQQSVLALRHHSDKVQALAWHTREQALLLTAAYDRKASVVDVRSPGSVRSWSLGADADPEAAAWDPHTEHQFAIASEDGSVRCFDARKEGAPLWTLMAHKKAASSLDYNPLAVGVLATGSADKTVKLWDVSGATPALLATKDMELGKVFSVKFSPDSASLLAAGGSKGKLGVWNTLEQEAMQERLPDAQAPLDEEGRVLGGAVAGMGALDVNSSDDEDGEEGGGGIERMLGGADAEDAEGDSEEDEQLPAAAAAGSSSSTAARTAGARSAKMRASAGRGKATVRVKPKSKVGR